MKLCFAFSTFNGINPIWKQYFAVQMPENCEEFIIIQHRDKKVNFITINPCAYFYYDNPNKWSGLNMSLELLKIAKSHGCDKIIFLSDSCIPVKPMMQLYEHLKGTDGKSLMHYFLLPKTDKAYSTRLIPQTISIRQHYHKNHPWVIIDKAHFDVFLNFPDNDLYAQTPCDTESYWSTVLHIYGLQEQIINECLTYSDWTRSPDGLSPYSFKEYKHEDDAVLLKLNADNHTFFARKFNPLLPEYQKLIESFI